ncbi:sigma-70 family RNA polymerase sigma factor [Nocardioides sp. WS12]|uniref:sigma-70 family RNA polymerase sigma factor n=1 Tax=Nocardioides sp. WS12 TaxID=2486272 RepID=UPI0015FBB2B2|nr:sigma-70 family RNA polymerase sigma factor [Nocardioides sp. WS12]
MADDARRELDEQLLDRVRAGDGLAYEDLYRAHIDGARHLARILVGTDHADELVAESFARVLAALRAGGGPTDNFRAYLHVTIRNGYRDGLRAPREAPVSDQPWLFDDAQVPAEEMVAGLDETVAVDALSSLPESWQRVLWHVEVEGRKPAEVATIMDLQPRAVSSLAHRAREGLKRAYLDLHAGPAPEQEKCQWAHARMSQYARGDLSPRAELKFGEHIDSCPNCNQAFVVVDRVNQKLAAYVLPIVLLAVLPGGGKGLLWLVGAGGGVAATGGVAASGGATSGAASSGGSAVGGPVAVGVAAAVAIGAIAAGALALSGESDPHPGDGAAPADVAPVPVVEPVETAPKPAPSTDRPVLRTPAPVEPEAEADVVSGPSVVPAARRPRPSTAVSPVPVVVPVVPVEPADPCVTDDPCVRLADVGTTAGPGPAPSQVSATVDVFGGPARTIELVFVFDGAVTVPAGGRSGAGWTCTVLDPVGGGLEVGAGAPYLVIGQLTPVTCSFAYDAAEPPPLTLTANPLLAPPTPAGSVTLVSAGEQVATQRFPG